MKKLYSLLVVLFAIVTMQANAQLSCNAAFTTQFLNGSTVKFNSSPLVSDSPNVYHFWSYTEVGGGYFSYSYAVSPTNIFPTGVFSIGHRVYRFNPNGGVLCTDSTNQIITVAQGACLISSYIYSYPSQTNPLQRNYYCSINNSSPTDSIRWTFGDGTSSNAFYPIHTFPNYGIYNVCLRVIKRNANGTLSNCISETCKLDTIAPAPCNLQANFTWYRDSLITVPNSYHFTNSTVPLSNTDSIRWTFGDGTSSNQVNPVHAYTTTGTFTVCLRVIKRNPNGTLTNCESEKCYPIIVNIPTPPCTLVANYTWYRDSLPTVALYTYHFTNTSTPLAATDSIRWSFGDGTFSNQVNPNHTYAQPGTYTVCLRIIKRNANGTLTNCIKEKCYSIVIAPFINPCTLVANYTWYRDSLPNVAANTIHFINTSAPVASTDSIRWTFGDGTFSSQLNPTHVYAQAGTYIVCLRIIKRSANGALTNCIKEKCYTIVITQSCNIAANYTWQADVSNYKKINFTNTTIAPASATALWNFGDGTTGTTWNASHIYAQAGTYYICLRVQNGNCISYKCDSITITIPVPVPTCTQLSSYTFIRTNNTVTFAPTFVATGVQYTWAFGDGTGAQGANATHIYATAGTYTACLTAYKNNNCASTTCNTITILPTINCNNFTLSINHVRDTLVPNRIKFTAVTNTIAVSQQWTITKIPSTPSQTPVVINTNNPTYMFLDSGYYNVCVRVTYANGCIKNVCKTIYINQNMPSTNVCILQVYPNPATSVVNAAVTLLQPQLINARVYNTSNIQVAQSQQQGVVGLNTVSVNVANLPAGIYTLRVLYGGQACYAAFIKQ